MERTNNCRHPLLDTLIQRKVNVTISILLYRNGFSDYSYYLKSSFIALVEDGYINT